MKSFKQYITEAERYEFDPPVDLDFENDIAWDWTVGPFYNFARYALSADGPMLPAISFDRYPWSDSLGTWQNPPPGWRVKNPNLPINDRDNWEYIPRPHIRGPSENGRWVWIPANGGKWVYTTQPVDVVPDTPVSMPTHQEVPWTQGPWLAQPSIPDISQVNESWWWLIPEILGDVLPSDVEEEPIYLPDDQMPYMSPTAVPDPYDPDRLVYPIIDPRNPSEIPIWYNPVPNQFATPAPPTPKPPKPPGWPADRPWPPPPPPNYTKPPIPIPNFKPINPSISPGGGQGNSPSYFGPAVDPNILPITR